MMDFTMPLIKQIYGEASMDIKDVSQLIAMFSTPDKEEALKNLKYMAGQLKIDLAEVPRGLRRCLPVPRLLSELPRHFDPESDGL